MCVRRRISRSTASAREARLASVSSSIARSRSPRSARSRAAASSRGASATAVPPLLPFLPNRISSSAPILRSRAKLPIVHLNSQTGADESLSAASRKVTGERVSSAEAGFNPTWQRHVAAYALVEPMLPDGRLLDLGCGVGHSYHLLAGRETVGVDLDAGALEGQARETHVADMRALPFTDREFSSVLSVQSLEHVPDPDRVVTEAARVVAADGVVVFVTPNRLTLGRPDEIIDPYHHIEFDAGELAALCSRSFGSVEVLGLFGSERYMELFDEERRKLDRMLAKDPVRLRRFVPRRAKQALYDRLLRRNRAQGDPRAAAIVPEDFELRRTGLESALDVIAVCRQPL